MDGQLMLFPTFSKILSNKFTLIKKNFSPSSKDFLIIDINQDIHNADFLKKLIKITILKA